MGSTDSKQKLGERVISARRKLDDDVKLQSDRSKDLQSKSPQTMQAIIQSIEESFHSYSPFLEPTLLIAWSADPQQCKDIIINSCQKVLSAPIIKEEYQWFNKYVFPSSVWMFKTQSNRFMYEELLDVANNMSKDIINSMDSIYNHLESHPKWREVRNIKSSSLISRQDHKSVGLLHGKGIRDILEVKEEDSKSNDDTQTFIDSNLAINTLTTTAKKIDREFQNYIQATMGQFGGVKAGPMKKVERCLSKLENDYQNAQYPKSAKLLDLVRCSVSFNTVDQLLNGYKGLMAHISNKSSDLELARVKNGFLDKHFSGGYRDIKVNVVYHSSIHVGVSMICEVQLLLNQYLHEKKRIHKLYSIIRQQLYFKMVVTDGDTTQTQLKDIKDLKLTPVFNLSEDVKMEQARDVPFTKYDDEICRCCTDPELNVFAIEGSNWIACVDISTKEPIFKQKTETYGSYACNWAVINNQKYLSVKAAKNSIKMFKVAKNNGSYSFEEDEKFGINLPSTDKIGFCEFDKHFENIIVFRNDEILEKRSVTDVSVVTKSITLEHKLGSSIFKPFSLSNSGKFCVLAGGIGKPYSYFIDIENDKQTKLSSGKVGDTVYVACFVNGEPERVAIGADNGTVEIWDVVQQEVIKSMKPDTGRIRCLASTNNILAIGSDDQVLRLYDVRNWEIFYSQKYKTKPKSIHLTADSKYLTIGGYAGEKCIVLQIQ